MGADHPSGWTIQSIRKRASIAAVDFPPASKVVASVCFLRKKSGGATRELSRAVGPVQTQSLLLPSARAFARPSELLALMARLWRAAHRHVRRHRCRAAAGVGRSGPAVSGSSSPHAPEIRLAEELLASLQGEPDAEVEAAWEAEIERRITEIESDKARLIPAEEVFAEARKLLK